MADPAVHSIEVAPVATPSAQPTPADIVDAIKDILKTADLTTLSSKKVRLELATKFGCDLTSRKKEVDGLLMTEIGIKQEADAKAAAALKKNGEKNDKKEEQASSSDDDSGPEAEPINRNVKSVKSQENGTSVASTDDDEAMARSLQRDEMGMRRTRNELKKPMKRKTKKTTDDDGEPKPKRRTAFNKELFLSDELSEFLGESKMQRSDIVKRVWAYIKENELQDPKNKQFVKCDSKLYTVFKVVKFKGFGMMKYLALHCRTEE